MARSKSIFPEFAGKLLRLPRDLVSRTVYRDGLTAMRVYDRHVSRHLADARWGWWRGRIRRAGPIRPAPRAFAAEERPVVLIGLRVQNRAVPDGIGFWRGVIEHLSYRLGRMAVVIDGVNARLGSDPSTDYGSFGPRTARPPVLDELEIVIRLRQHFSELRCRSSAPLEPRWRAACSGRRRRGASWRSGARGWPNIAGSPTSRDWF